MHLVGLLGVLAGQNPLPMYTSHSGQDLPGDAFTSRWTVLAKVVVAYSVARCEGVGVLRMLCTCYDCHPSDGANRLMLGSGLGNLGHDAWPDSLSTLTTYKHPEFDSYLNSLFDSAYQCSPAKARLLASAAEWQRKWRALCRWNCD